MAQLDANWITRGIIDFEYKKYLLLGYLQSVSKHFDDRKLYPFLSDLVFHYNNLVSLKRDKTIAVNKFPKKLSKIEFQNFKLEYERVIQDDEYMEEIESIVEYAIPKFKEHLREGKDLFEYVEEKLEIFPIGVLPLYPVEGYLILKEKNKSDAKVYQYCVTIFEKASEKYRGLKTQYLTSYTVSLTNTFEMMKVDLLKNNKSLPNPAAYAVESFSHFPYLETLLPIAKRVLVKTIGENLDG